MLIPLEDICNVLSTNSITFTGALHLGAHECEEIDFYADIGISYHDVAWVEAMEDKVFQAQGRGIPNVYNALITDKDGEIVTFNVSNDGQSSSVLDFKIHAEPNVFYVDKIRTKTTTINSFFKTNNLDRKKYDFWNLHIQGAELLALKGATEYLKYAKALYLEVNKMYKGCGLLSEIDEFLLEHGFKRVLIVSESGHDNVLYIASSCLKASSEDITLTITEQSSDQMKNDMKKMLNLLKQLLNQMTSLVDKYNDGF